VEYAPEGGPDKRCYRVNFSKIQRALPSFRPQWNARKGAQELYDAYRAVGMTADDIESGRYIRLGEIRRLTKSGKLSDSLRWANSGNTFPTRVSESPLVAATRVK
jgi:hypothetical protein